MRHRYLNWLNWTLPGESSGSAAFRGPLSATGLLLSALFFSASLSPSLVPRDALMQGILSGLSAGIGYGAGVFGCWVWAYLELPFPGPATARKLRWLASAGCLAVAAIFLWNAMGWQNSLRELMEMQPLDARQPLTVGAVALAVFGLIILFSRLFHVVFRILASRLSTRIPPRIATLLAVCGAALLFWSLVDGIVFRQLLRVADTSYEAFDSFADVDIAQPRERWQTGSDVSLIDWDSLGRRGREFIAGAPPATEISEQLGTRAMDPLRIYVGLRSADDAQTRARLALQEMLRVGAFERSVVVVATPTGTGWMDPMAMDTLDYLHAGDVATVAVQYSYLASWLSLLVEPGYGAETSRALFAAVYGHWKSMPSEQRPRLYLFGLSLGALSSERSASFYELLGEPPQGAFWVGPPFASSIWRHTTEQRVASSPAWLPRYGDGSIVRYTGQTNALAIDGAKWGPLRIVYLQYASDPITFFEPTMFFRQPEWFLPPRGPDVSADLRWYPIVTGLQVAVDIMLATEVPLGYGHAYAPEHYIDGWLEVTQPAGWTETSLKSLKARFAGRR